MIRIPIALLDTATNQAGQKLTILLGQGAAVDEDLGYGAPLRPALESRDKFGKVNQAGLKCQDPEERVWVGLDSAHGTGLHGGHLSLTSSGVTLQMGSEELNGGLLRRP
jgi:hypothetical protein